MRIIEMGDLERFRTGLYAGATKPAKSKKAVKPPAGKVQTAKPAQNPMAAPKSGGATVGKTKGKSSITPNHQKLHAMARTHGFQHVGMSVYQHPTAGLTLSVGPQGWSLSDGTQGTDWEDLQTHLEKSFGLPMVDPNAIDPATGQPMNAQPARGAKKPGMGGQPKPAGPAQGKQKSPNSFQAAFMGQ